VAVAETVAHPAVVVSLTFDDGSPDQLQADTIMARYGMHGTFYVNSGRLNQPGYMSASQVVTLQSDGNEVAGHTVSHADLPTLTQDEATREVCNDRVNLLGLGLNVRNFAYPFGDNNAAVQQIVKNCGYNSARRVGDIVSPGTCSGCRYAESIPPANPYAVITPDSIKSDTSLLDMENYVLQAEQNGGGWVPLVMHHVCTGCNTLSITPALLDAFLAWLAPRAADGTIVKTIEDVIGGPLQAPVSGPLLPPPSPGNMLRNPSMEQIGSSGTPTCWQRGGYGTNTAAWSDTSDAQEGVNAQRVDITSLSSGDRKMISPQDLGGCAPPTVVGHTYLVQGWYKTNGMVRMVAYSRNSLGGWTWFAQGPTLASSAASYTHAAWTTPAMPAGSTAVSVGFSLSSVGFLQGDNMSLSDSDQTPPAVAITSPADNAAVRGTLTLTADASDASGIDHVQFLVNGVAVCTTSVAPYSCTYDTTIAPDSVIAVTAKAVDTAGNEGLSAGNNYTVSNSVPLDTTAPTVSLTSPADGASVSGTIGLTADAADNDKVIQVLFYVNGIQVGATNTAPFQTSWDSTTIPDGSVNVVAKAMDASGNQTSSTPLTVTVNNNAQDSTPPTTTTSCNGLACSTSWYKKAVSLTLAATDPSPGSGVANIVYTTDGTDPTGSNGTVYTGAFTLAATTTVKYRAYDVAGNAETVRSIVLSIDTVPPTATVSSPSSGATVTGTTYIVAGVSDNVAVVRVWFYLDGKALGSRIVTPLQWKWDTTTTTKGTHTLFVIAADAAGNSTTSATTTVSVQ
jgi:peptidoglycan/xylan/chitin deacetylase (PgdA/CDA1 family)